MAAAAEETPKNGARSSFVEGENASISDWFEQVGGSPNVKVALRRVSPKTFRGQNTSGHVDTIEGFIDEEEIHARYGGGKYEIRVSAPDNKGKYKYKAGTTITIAGNPKLSEEDEFGMEANAPQKSSVQAEVVKQSMALTAQQLRAAEERAERAAGAAGTSHEFILDLQTSIRREAEERIRAVERAAEKREAELMAQITTLSTREDPFKEMSMRMYEGENRRLETLREMHASELRTVRENHNAEVRQIREAFAQDLQARERVHEREIQTLTMSFKSNSTAEKSANETRVETLKSQIAALERDLSEARAKVGALEARKDKSVIEQMTEISQMREALEAFGGGGDGESSKWWEKLAEVAMGSPVAMKLIGAVAPEEEGGSAQAQLPAPARQQVQASAPAASPAGQALPPVNQPFQGPNGEIFVRTPDDRIVQITEEQARQIIEAAQEGAEEPDGAPPSAEQVKVAVSFMENAIRNDMEPDAFAQTIKGRVPGDILRYIELVGVDHFLDNTAQLGDGHILRTEHGRIFVKQVVGILLQGQ